MIAKLKHITKVVPKKKVEMTTNEDSGGKPGGCTPLGN